MKLFDTHCHLQDERLISDVTSVIAKAGNAGVTRILCCGSSEKDWPDVKILYSTYPEIIPSFGLHPWYVHKRAENWQKTLEKFLVSIPAAAVGEIGLDHALENRNDDDQYKVFVAQLQLAAKLNRPASIHCRKAWEPLLKALNEVDRLSRGFAIHSYSGPPDLIPQLVEKGAFFSFSGSVTRSGNKRARKSAVNVPLERLLIETDAPDLPPVVNGKPVSLNEPANLVYVLREMASIRNVSLEELASQLWENSYRLFV
ncbi:MAG: TatD family hydrolase [Kiritimatiellae bacterium]|nr:TatD family hydrolase [Kiritimatiellia bacterium]MDD5521508.1 TatD family hydrolase [Kiritimatiellia bacterium]